ncbi:hypothetical protein [Dechloromonas hortensis]|uniref:hypothetical protein n=1 Tax=Dechloromonas hortensis TaxID=337779 RepID=UPI001290DB69|nr:hypothetical protein [Dechloromonas hortensis]
MNKKIPPLPDTPVTLDEPKDSSNPNPGYQIPKENMFMFQQFSGDIPMEKMGNFHWRPIEGALLVSGINMDDGGSRLDEDLFDVMRHVANIPAVRVRHAKYVFEQWCEAHDPAKPISPEYFLGWFKENPVPPLNYLGRPIKARITVNLPESDEQRDIDPVEIISSEALLAKVDKLSPDSIGSLTTSEISLAFQGIGEWTAEQWSENITRGDWAKVDGALAQPGKQGRNGTALWRPIRLALAALGHDLGELDDFGKAFRYQELLQPWLEAWREVEENRRWYDENP